MKNWLIDIMEEATQRIKFHVWFKHHRRALVSIFETRHWLKSIGHKGGRCDLELAEAAHSLALDMGLAKAREQQRRESRIRAAN